MGCGWRFWREFDLFLYNESPALKLYDIFNHISMYNVFL